MTPKCKISPVIACSYDYIRVYRKSFVLVCPKPAQFSTFTQICSGEVVSTTEPSQSTGRYDSTVSVEEPEFEFDDETGLELEAHDGEF